MKTLRRGVLLLLLLGCLGAWLWLRHLERGYREEPYTLIEERLYVGGSVAQPPPGTRAVVNLCDRKDTFPADVCLDEPILDGPKPPDLDWLRRVVEFIDARRREGATTFIHCNAGVSRSGFVATAYLMYEHGWPRDEALDYLRSKRPRAQPNPAFLRRLAEWEEALKGQVAPGEK